MKRNSAKHTLTETELLILPDGRVLVHNLTSTVAEALVELNPDDSFIHRRAFVKRRDDSNATSKRRSNKLNGA
jgi:hypothetical protein